jgi:hypothetical protein
MKKPALLLAILLCSTMLLTAQVQLTPTVIAAGGGYGEGEGISLSWTIGELAVTTLTAGDLVLTQGFQQPFDIDVIGTRDQQVSWGISVYPNPVKDQLRIKFNVETAGDYLLEVQDVTGRIVTQKLHKEVRPGDIVLLNTSTYLPGVYFLKVYTRDRLQVQVTGLRKL